MASDGKNIDEIYDRMREVAREEAARIQVVDHWGTVHSASGNTAEVVVDGGEGTTPCTTVSELKRGDRVLVNIDPTSRKATVKGNATDLSVGEREVQEIAQEVVSSTYETDLSRFQAELDALVATTEEETQRAIDAAASTSEHFTHDSGGAHVTNDYSDSNILMNSLGVLLRTANHIDMSVTSGAVQFYDEDGTVIGSYSKSGVSLGDPEGVHFQITQSGWALYSDRSNMIAYTAVDATTNQSNLYVQRLVVDGDIRFGDWMWYSRSNGNMSVKWMGE